MSVQPKNVLISNVKLNYARLDTPADNPFGGPPAWEVQMVSEDRATFAAIEEMGGKVKEVDGGFAVSVRRKSETKDKTPMEPVRVVDASKTPMDGPARRKIGNGSVGNVIVWCAPYEYMNRKGITFSLTAVQVSEMVEYVGSGAADIDFDVIGNADLGGDSIDF